MSDSRYFFVRTSSKKPFHSKLLKSILKRNTESKYDAYAEEKSNSISYWKIKHCDSLTLIRIPKIVKEDVVTGNTPLETISQQTIHKGQAFSNDQLEPLEPKFSHNQTSRKRRSRLSRPGNCILNIDCLGGIEDRFNGEIQHQSVISNQFDDEDNFNLDRYPSTSTLNNVGEQKQEYHDEGDGQLLLEDSYSIVLRNLLRLNKLINHKDQIFKYSQPTGDIIVPKSKSVKKITKCNMKGPKFLREQATSKIPKLATVSPKFSREQTTSNISKLATVSPKFSREQTTSNISKLATVSSKFSRGQTTSKISKLATVSPKFSREQTTSNISKLATVSSKFSRGQTTSKMSKLATVSPKFSREQATSNTPKLARATVSPKFSQKPATSKLPKKLANLSPKFSPPITHAAKGIKPINSKDKRTQTAPDQNYCTRTNKKIQKNLST